MTNKLAILSTRTSFFKHTTITSAYFYCFAQNIFFVVASNDTIFKYNLLDTYVMLACTRKKSKISNHGYDHWCRKHLGDANLLWVYIVRFESLGIISVYFDKSHLLVSMAADFLVKLGICYVVQLFADHTPSKLIYSSYSLISWIRWLRMLHFLPTGL